MIYTLDVKKIVRFPNESLERRASFGLSPFITPLKNTSRIWLCNKAPGCHIHMLMFTKCRYNKLNWTRGAELLPVWVDATFIEYKSRDITKDNVKVIPSQRDFGTADPGGIQTLICMQGCFSQLCSQINSWLFDFTMMFSFVLFCFVFSALFMQRSSWSQRTPTTWHSSLKQHKYKLWSHYRHLNMWISLLRLLWEEPRYLRLTLGDGGSPFLLMGSWWAFFYRFLFSWRQMVGKNAFRWSEGVVVVVV